MNPGGRLPDIRRAFLRPLAPALIVAAAMAPGTRGATVEVVGGDPLEFGSVLLGSMPAGSVTLQKKGNGNGKYTTTVSNDGISAPVGQITGPRDATGLLGVALMNNANGCATAGPKSYTIDLSPATPGGDDRIEVSAVVYAPASLTANDGTLLYDGSSISVQNASGPYRSAAFVDSYSIAAGWSLVGLGVGSGIPAGGGTPGASVLFDQSGLLNGLQVEGSLSVWLENDQTYYGAGERDLGPLTWGLSHLVLGNVGDGTAPLDVGESFGGLYGVSDHALGTTASLLDGNAGGMRTLAISWRDRSPGESGPISDIATMSGNGSDLFVLQMDYDPALLGLSENDLVGSGLLYLGWNDGDAWINAVERFGTAASLFTGDRAYDPSADLILGTWGVDTNRNTVWAVLDAGGEFAVVPEPGALLLLPLATLLLKRR